MKAALGYFLIGAAIFVFIFSLLPIGNEEIKYQLWSLTKPDFINEIVPVDKDFGLIIPSLNINVRVIKDVDPFNQDIYQQALTKGVAHAKGSYYPGTGGNTFIFSHSSENFYMAQRYNSIFYLLNKLVIGDTITVYYNNNKFDYKVSEKKIVDPSEIKYLTDNSDNSLSLMTCYPPGTEFKRLIIVAK